MSTSKYLFRFFLMVITMVVAHQSFGQKKLNELEQALGAAKTDKSKAEAGLAIAQYYLDKNDAACIQYAETALKPAKKAKMETTEASLHNIIGTYYFGQKNYKKAVAALEDEYVIRKKLQQARPRAVTCYNLGYCYSKLKNNRKAKKYYDESLALANKLGDKQLLNNLTRELSQVSLAEKNYKSAYEYLNNYLQAENKKFKSENAKLLSINEEQEHVIEQKDSTINEVNLKNQLLESESKLIATELNRKKLELQNQEMNLQLIRADIETERQHKHILCLISIIILLLLAVTIWGFLNKRKTNKELKKKNEKIENQNKEINNQNIMIKTKNEVIEKNMAQIASINKDLTDSINYAAKIQTALLRHFENYTKYMNDYFLFYAPKDIVSGDFYWAHKIDNKLIFTVGDCTGHSVPGAFMSTLALALLNQLVGQKHLIKASEILEQMRMLVKLYLGQKGLDNREPKDGMDMSLCVWDLDTNDIDFAGAYNPLVHVRDKVATVYSAVKSPVGIHTKELPFDDKYLTVQKGDRLYLFSDGYSDQFDEIRIEKFKMSRFRQMLADTSNQPMAMQCETIKDKYYKWKGNFMQIDDVCVMGVEI